MAFSMLHTLFGIVTLTDQLFHEISALPKKKIYIRIEGYKSTLYCHFFLKGKHNAIYRVIQRDGNRQRFHQIEFL